MLGMNAHTIFAWMTESYEKYMSFNDAAVKEIDQFFFSEIQNKQELQKQENIEKQRVQNSFTDEVAASCDA